MTLKTKPNKKRARKTSGHIVEPVLSKFPLDKTKHEGYSTKYKVRRCPSSKKEITKLANEMVKWAILDGDAYAIEDFPLSKCIAPSDYYKCAVGNEYFRRALEITKYIIGSRLQAAARAGDIDSRFVLKILPLYNPEFKELMMSKIKQFQQSIAAPPIKVVIEKFQECEKIPPKKIE